MPHLAPVWDTSVAIAWFSLIYISPLNTWSFAQTHPFSHLVYNSAHLQTCFTPTRNNKRLSGVCATRLSGAWRWPARSKKGKTPSALAFRGPSVDSLYMVELNLDVN